MNILKYDVKNFFTFNSINSLTVPLTYEHLFVILYADIQIYEYKKATHTIE